MRICRCAVRDCTNTTENVNLRFHSFPRNKELTTSWVAFTGDERLIQRLQRGSAAFLHGLRVCSIHFKNEDFQNDLRLRLLRNRVPSLYPPGDSPSSDLDVNVHKTAMASTSSALSDSRSTSRSPIKPGCLSPSSSVSCSSDLIESHDSRDFEDVHQLNESLQQRHSPLMQQLPPSLLLPPKNFNQVCHQYASNVVRSSSPLPVTWNSARVEDPPSFDLPREDEILHLLLFVKSNRDSERLSARDVDEINILLNISADWRELPESTRKYLYHRIRLLGVVSRYGWEATNGSN